MTFMKRAVLVTTAVSAIALAVAISPAGAGVPPTTTPQIATLTITKVVQGTAPADAEFTIVADCEASGEHELTFGAEGGEQEIVFSSADVCDITEPGDGGASSTTGLGEIGIFSPTDYARSVINTFDPESATTVDTAAEVATRPTFTG